MLYYKPNSEEIKILWELAIVFSEQKNVTLYMIEHFDIKITKDDLIISIKRHFFDMFIVLFNF